MIPRSRDMKVKPALEHALRHKEILEVEVLLGGPKATAGLCLLNLRSTCASQTRMQPRSDELASFKP